MEDLIKKPFRNYDFPSVQNLKMKKDCSVHFYTYQKSDLSIFKILKFERSKEPLFRIRIEFILTCESANFIIVQSGNHFGKRTASSLLYFLSYVYFDIYEIMKFADSHVSTY